MGFIKPSGISTDCCMLLILLFLPHGASQIKFTSQYGGNTKTALAGSFVNLTWSFSGGSSGVDRVSWGLTQRNGIGFINNGMLVSLNPSSGLPVSVSVPAAYSGRVSGSVTGNKFSGQAIFKLSSIKKSDEGFYGCRIDPISDYDYLNFDTVYLAVQGPPSITGISSNQTVNEGDKVTLNCTAEGNPPPTSITWTRVSDDIVVIFPLTIKKEDQGGYRCTAHNGIGSASIDVFITVHGELKFTSQYQGNTTTALAGSSVNFTWSFTDDSGGVDRGVDRVSWGLTQRNGIDFINNGILVSLDPSSRLPVSVSVPAAYSGRVTGSVTGNKFSGQAIFKLSSIRKSDEGFYGCRIDPVSDFDSPKFDTVYLAVQGPPSITHISSNQTENEGDKVTLNCTADGNPPPTSITWTRLSDNSLVTFPLTISRQDQGSYRCTADNGIGLANSDVFITVHYGATITSATPTVTQSWIRRTVRLTCVADGFPTPVLTWKKPDGSELKKVTATKNVANAEMKGDNDFGFYTCHAENGIGAAATRRVEVKQIKAPGSPIITLDVQATSVSVTWTASDNGGSAITGYRVVLLQGDSPIKNESVTNKLSWSKGELIKNTSYTVKVYARNSVFEGNAAEKKFTTNYEGPPAAPEIIDLPSSTNDVEITIKWTEPENNGAPITHYTVYQRTVGDNGTPQEWRKMNEIKDPSVRQVAFKLEKGKNYEFVVTATNKFGPSIIEDEKIKKIKVLGDIPAPVQLTAEVKGSEITLKWKEPENNGAAITKYSVYQKNVNDEQWKKVEDITDTTKREYVLKWEEDKEYEFVVTATNKYGESLKKEKKKAKVLKASPEPPDTQKGRSCDDQKTILHAVYTAVIILLLIVILVLLVLLRRTRSCLGNRTTNRRNKCPRCGDLVAMVAMGSGGYGPLDPSAYTRTLETHLRCKGR